MSNEQERKPEDRDILPAFMNRNKISGYRLAILLDVPRSTIADWTKRGPQHCKLLRFALKALEQELNQ